MEGWRRHTTRAPLTHWYDNLANADRVALDQQPRQTDVVRACVVAGRGFVYSWPHISAAGSTVDGYRVSITTEIQYYILWLLVITETDQHFSQHCTSTDLWCPPILPGTEFHRQMKIDMFWLPISSKFIIFSVIDQLSHSRQNCQLAKWGSFSSTCFLLLQNKCSILSLILLRIKIPLVPVILTNA